MEDMQPKHFYIDCLNLINLCVKHGVLKETTGILSDQPELKHIPVVMENNNVIFYTKENLARELMDDGEGWKCLTSEMEKLSVQFYPTNFALD